jgi:hypothetical protein
MQAKLTFATRLPLATRVCILFSIFGDGHLLAQTVVPQAGVPCGEYQQHEIIRHEDHPLPAPSADKALIFVMYDSFFSLAKTQRKLAVDHVRWVAVNKKADYTFFEVAPGTVTLSYYGEGPTLSKGLFRDVPLEVRANQSYLITLKPHVDKFDFSQTNQPDIAERLRKLTYVTFVPRGTVTDDQLTESNTKFLKQLGQIRVGMTPAELYTLLGFPAQQDYIDQVSSLGAGLILRTRRSIPGQSSAVGCGHIFTFYHDSLQSWR